ncbi:hypothetical protein A4S06_09150 [Erysipelotrichaceae bacterium MTC7]|nr:hypothetical protein A4S06_09150 [Erysipelotrichaceae bacterium MTC7]
MVVLLLLLTLLNTFLFHIQLMLCLYQYNCEFITLMLNFEYQSNLGLISHIFKIENNDYGKIKASLEFSTKEFLIYFDDKLIVYNITTNSETIYNNIFEKEDVMKSLFTF